MENTVPAGIDYKGVSRYFATHVPGGSAPLDVALISGGKSNLTYKVSTSGRAWVLRRPPLGHVLPTAHDMAREYRVISALEGTGVPVPRTVALCEDTAINGAPFYVMDFVDGLIIGEELPAGAATTLGEREAISRGLIETLVKLHAVDYEAVGLRDFGRPDGYLERQVRRWSEQWDRSETRPLPEIRELMRRLRNAIPQSPPPTIVHGDYRLGNMILDATNQGRVRAILDWEMCTLGDPLSDLGYTLGYWGNIGDDPSFGAASPAAQITRQPGFFTRAELVAYYGKLSGRDVSNVEYYQVLATYKLAVICEGIHARFLAGETVGDGFEGYGERTEMLVRAAMRIADGAADSRMRGLG